MDSSYPRVPEPEMDLRILRPGYAAQLLYDAGWRMSADPVGSYTVWRVMPEGAKAEEVSGHNRIYLLGNIGIQYPSGNYQRQMRFSRLAGDRLVALTQAELIAEAGG